jgi:DNA (cytosine-5)-methyltransferase 1
MRYLSLFSGIEAATVAWKPLGWECVGVAEIEPFPCAVLAHHYPDVPNLGSVTDITEEQIKALGHIDIVVFGSPCQDLSVAGHRKGLINANGTVTRSGLFFTAINICKWSRARFWLWENVPGAFSSNKGRDFASVVEFMAGMDECPIPPKGWGTEGVAVGDNGLVEWATLDAQWFGVAQRRRRVFALTDTGDWANRPPILLEPDSLRGDSAPSREKEQEVAGTISKCSFAGGAGGRPEGAAAGHFVAQWPCEVAPTLNAHFGEKQGLENQHIRGGRTLCL